MKNALAIFPKLQAVRSSVFSIPRFFRTAIEAVIGPDKGISPTLHRILLFWSHFLTRDFNN